MKANDYNFKVGDKVITVYGEVGQIVDICQCENCEKRGFYEPIWMEDGFDERHYITSYMADVNFDEFRQIGKYRFEHPFAKDLVKRAVEHHKKMMARYKKCLSVIEEMGKENN